ncbi:caspase domain-containing protein [Paenarthrobacter sp. NPDC089675]|uniref:caspase family protein n=1 Tax=Paenarthrobacter sp. NPDC089675 TaxID=3364376 RepID=UPI00381E52E2
MSRKALIVGIDHYEAIRGLSGCVNDAYSVKSALERNADGTTNFPSPLMLLGTGPTSPVSKKQLKSAVRELFADEVDIALFYFSGHGYIEDTGGFLCASDSETGDDGLSLTEVMQLANTSRARNRIIILDSCHSGIAGGRSGTGTMAEITDGVTILAASKADQYALEVGGSGVFTALFTDALLGAAGNLVGDVTPGSIYAHVDQSLGPWSQRPVFKTNVKTFVSLRKTEPPIGLTDLRELTRIFPSPDHVLQLDPSFEPERSSEQLTDASVPEPDPAKVATFKILQNYVRVNLARPEGAPHMWHAAMESKACELTVLGQHYWRLVKEELI